jgi:hypothetical protein
MERVKLRVSMRLFEEFAARSTEDSICRSKH